MARKNITIKNSIVELVCGSVMGELVQIESGSSATLALVV